MTHSRWFVVVVLLTFLLVACGAQEPGGTEQTRLDPETGTSDQQPPESMPDTFVRVYISHPAHLDPHGSGWDNSYDPVLRNLYEPLVEWSPTEDQIVGVLAERWEMADDAMSVTFWLHPNVKFHDGSTLSGADVKASIERVLTLGYGRAGLLRDVERVETDGLEVTVHLRNPDAAFVARIAPIYIASAAAIGAHPEEEWWHTNVAGTGAWIPRNFTPNAEVIRFDRFEDYRLGWSGDRFEHVESRVVPESVTQRLLLEQGEAHFMTRFPIGYVSEMAEMPGVKVESYPTFRISNLPLNTARPPLDDIRVRKALQYAFPYEDLLNGYYQGLAQPAAGPVHPALLPDPDLTVWRQDLDRARALLEEAGYENGLTLEYLYPTGGEEQQMPGVLFQDALAKINVTLEVETIPWTNIVDRVKSPDTAPDVMTLINSPIVADPAAGVLESLYHSMNAGGPYNWGYYRNPEFDDLLQRAKSVADPEDRAALYREAQGLVMEDAGALVLGFPDRWYAMAEQIQGLTFNPVGMEVQNWWAITWED